MSNRETYHNVLETLYSRVGKTAIMETAKRLVNTHQVSPRESMHAPTTEIAKRIASKEADEPRTRSRISDILQRKVNKRKVLGTSFCAVSREQRETTLSEHGRKPCVGQYTPNYVSVTK